MRDEIFFFSFPAVNISHLQVAFVTFARGWMHTLEVWPGRELQCGNPASTMEGSGLSCVEMATESVQHG